MHGICNTKCATCACFCATEEVLTCVVRCALIKETGSAKIDAHTRETQRDALKMCCGYATNVKRQFSPGWIAVPHHQSSERTPGNLLAEIQTEALK